MICNGIDTDQLRGLATALVDQPPLAAASIEVEASWEERYRLTASARGITCGGQQVERSSHVLTDRPAALGGADTGPAPGELLLSALGACVAQAFVEGAALQAIEVHEFRLRVEGHLDLRGTLGAPEVHPGLARIELAAEVAADTDEPTLATLLDDAVRRSPVADSLMAGVTIAARVRQPNPA